MDGATLRLLETIRGAASVPSPPRSALEAFTCLLHGTPTPSLNVVERLWIEVVAEDAARHGWSRAEAFRVIYAGELAEEKITHRSADASGTLAIEGLLALPRPERAALALSCVLGFTDGEVAHVLGVAGVEAAVVIERGVTAVRRAARGDRKNLRRGGAAA